MCMKQGISQLLLLFGLYLLIALGHIDRQEKNEKSNGDSTAQEHFRKGSLYFRDGEFGKAAQHYRQAFDLEKKNPTLPRQFWYVLIDNLGMSYGISGDLNKAEDIFEYGISKDSTYPLFYYNMACTYAEREDLQNCIKYLRIAFRYKANVLEGEEFPHPATDDSFRRFMKNEEFLRVLEELRTKN